MEARHKEGRCMLVQTELRHRVEVITINRPEARNAIDYDTSQALADAFDAAEADPEVWAVVLTGAGDKAFSAGMDLKAFAGGGGNVMGVSGGFAGITRRDFPKPLIAAVNGRSDARRVGKECSSTCRSWCSPYP